MQLPKLPKPVVRLANAVTNLTLLAGIPRPPYTRGNALIVETVGRRSGKGLLSAILLYLPVCYWIARAAHREGRIGNAAGLAALAVGAAAMFCLAYFGLARAPVSA